MDFDPDLNPPPHGATLHVQLLFLRSEYRKFIDLQINLGSQNVSPNMVENTLEQYWRYLRERHTRKKIREQKHHLPFSETLNN